MGKVRQLQKKISELNNSLHLIFICKHLKCILESHLKKSHFVWSLMSLSLMSLSVSYNTCSWELHANSAFGTWLASCCLVKSMAFEWQSTVWCHYKAVDFLQNYHKRHPIAHPLGVFCGSKLTFIFCPIPVPIHILPQLLQWWVQYHVILDCFIKVYIKENISNKFFHDLADAVK